MNDHCQGDDYRMSELKPCPFCGSDDINDQDPCYTQIMCNHCGASIYDQETRADALRVWNMRVQEFKIGANDKATAMTLANDAQYVSYEQTCLEIARALSVARAQTFEAAAKIAEGIYDHVPDELRDAVDFHLVAAKERIAQAIRQHGAHE